MYGHYNGIQNVYIFKIQNCNNLKKIIKIIQRNKMYGHWDKKIYA